MKTRHVAFVLAAVLFSFSVSASALAGLKEGIEAMDKEDYDLAFFEISKAANDKDPEAQYYLGLLYLEGKGTEVDLKKAKESFEQSADAGYPPAQYQLALYLIAHPSATTGTFARYDRRLTLYWLRKAGYSGLIDAQLKLADMYEQGGYIKKDIVQAYAWLKRASLQYQPGEERNNILTRLIAMGDKMTLDEIELARQYSTEDFPDLLKP